MSGVVSHAAICRLLGPPRAVCHLLRQYPFGPAMNWTAIASIFLALAVGLGAFGAHGLRDKLDAYSLDVWNKAVFYHFIHGLGMLIASLMPRTSPVSEYACWAMAAGILIF